MEAKREGESTDDRSHKSRNRRGKGERTRKSRELKWLECIANYGKKGTSRKLREKEDMKPLIRIIFWNMRGLNVKGS